MNAPRSYVLEEVLAKLDGAAGENTMTVHHCMQYSLVGADESAIVQIQHKPGQQYILIRFFFREQFRDQGASHRRMKSTNMTRLGSMCSGSEGTPHQQ